MPLYSAGLWLAVNIAPGISKRPDAKYKPSVEHSPILITSTPAPVTPSINAETKSGPVGRISWPTTMRPVPPSISRIFKTSTKAIPTSRESFGSHCSGTTPRMS